jgi:hypothetical protein
VGRPLHSTTHVDGGALLAAAEVGGGGGLELLDVGDLLGVEVARDAPVDVGDLDGDLDGVELALLEGLDEAGAAVELLLGGGVEVGAELGELHNLAVLGELELQGAGDLLHGLELRGGADAGHGEADVDGGADALVEELGLEEDLAVGDGDHVGRDVGGHVVGHGLDDGEGREGAAAEGVGELGGALEEAGVEVEDVAGVGLASGGAAEQQGHLAVGDGLLGEVVVDDDGVAAVVAEELAHGAPGVGGEVLEGGGVGGDGGDDDGVGEGGEEVGGLLGRVEVAALVEVAGLLEDLGDARDGGLLLADADVDAVARLGGLELGDGGALAEVLLPAEALVEEGLVDDHVEADGGLARLAVADDELALAEADGHHGVHGGHAREEGAVDGLAGDDAGRVGLDGAAVAELHVAGEVEAVAGVDGRRVEVEGAVLVVDGRAEGARHAAEHADADVDGDDTLAGEDAVADLCGERGRGDGGEWEVRENGVGGENVGGGVVVWERVVVSEAARAAPRRSAPHRPPEIRCAHA